MQLPIGAEDRFEGVIDLIKMKAIYWDETNMGMTFQEKDIPADMQSLCEAWRARLVEAAAESSEELMDKYLLEETLSDEEIKQGIRQQTIANKLMPAFCGSAFKNKGVQAMLDAVIDYLPVPTDVMAIKGHLEDEETEEERPSTDDAPFAALAFKIATDPFVGALTFFRVYSGVLNSGDGVYNSVESE